MAFLSILSLFPFLVLIVVVAGYLGASMAGQEFIRILIETIPESFAQALSPRIKEIMAGPPDGLVTLSIVGAIWTASSSVEGLRTILNRVYKVTAPPPYISRRLLSIVQFLVFTFLILISMLIVIFTPIVLQSIEKLFPMIKNFHATWDYLRFIFASFTLFAVLCSIYYFI
ncbi:MAG: YihY/virulence factor BrkB family protein, partial [Methanobacterium sp.]